MQSTLAKPFRYALAGSGAATISPLPEGAMTNRVRRSEDADERRSYGGRQVQWRRIIAHEQPERRINDGRHLRKGCLLCQVDDLGASRCRHFGAGRGVIG